MRSPYSCCPWCQSGNYLVLTHACRQSQTTDILTGPNDQQVEVPVTTSEMHQIVQCAGCNAHYFRYLWIESERLHDPLPEATVALYPEMAVAPSELDLEIPLNFGSWSPVVSHSWGRAYSTAFASIHAAPVAIRDLIETILKEYCGYPGREGITRWIKAHLPNGPVRRDILTLIEHGNVSAHHPFPGALCLRNDICIERGLRDAFRYVGLLINHLSKGLAIQDYSGSLPEFSALNERKAGGGMVFQCVTLTHLSAEELSWFRGGA